MSTSQYVFLIGSGLAVLLGISLVLGTLLIFHRQRKGILPPGPQVDLKILGVEIRGGRPLVVFLVGVVLTIFPLWFSVDYSKPRPPPGPGLSIVPMPIEYIKVPEAAEPTYEGFHLLKDIRVIDLRSRIPVPEDKKGEEYSSVTWTRYTLLKKLSAGRTFVDFEFHTTGVALYARSLTHEYDLWKLTKPHFHGKIKMKHRWYVHVDVKDVKTNQDFVIINEATYWNAFSGEKKEWAVIVVTDETDVIAMVIMFPEDKPFKNFTLYAYPHGSRELKQFRGKSTVVPSENHQVLLWRIENPKKRYAYQLNWTW